MDDSFIKAIRFLLSNSMSNDPNILPIFINMLDNEHVTSVLGNLNINDVIIEEVLNIKNEIKNTNVINHGVIIDLFNQYNLDVSDDNSEIDLKKIIILMN
jgi:hypothetical protein